MELTGRYFQDPGCSFFLFGPRGTGKSTWLKTNLRNSLRVDLLHPESYRMFAARPERLSELIDGNPDYTTIIIDEIQKIPDLLGMVHQLIESRKDLRFVLTGSSARKLKRSEANLLAGRALYRTMHPFMASELGEKFDFHEALNTGLLPLIVAAPDSAQALDAYSMLYLNEEVKMEGLVRNVGDFTRFLEAISFSNGSVLNTSEVARDCQVSRKTVENYISILDDLLLSFQLPVFTKKAKRILIAHNKFYFFDTGVYRSLRPRGQLDRAEEIDGIALETLVIQHLRAWIAYSNNKHDVFFWRTKSGNEVDFVVYGDSGIYAIEVKNAALIRTKDLSGLKAFREDYPQAHCIFLYRGKEKLVVNNVRCIPCEDFLAELCPNHPLPGLKK
ncbi:MAG: AAA family ATPase [Bacteroidetes bacterium]|nr:AAA family ATPase [Bacteroidota bacterium]MBU1717547.1 AAA family ATPase [Bacteroidota bacterium]